ncbi:MFS transporter [Amaricoccus sp.]|uniref:MFS transporter n=1 Tax=Amaricoccus sp. TaxID=1872485 RepID=UPI001B542ACD|nr:MFS transporter [Amaricoccus sp.]MBP7241930.1 MFS transporter [Amaricoccus sp.]
MDAQAESGSRGALAPLANPTFRTFWIASLFSNLGGLIQAVGAAWTMTTISGSADMVALVQASTTLPIMLFSLASGAIADNFNRRSVMIAAQVGMFAVSAALALCAWAGLLTPWLLLGFTFMIGCGVALNNPSWQATVGDIVPRQDVPAAVALNSVGFNLTRSVGPAIGGGIVAAAGAAAAFAANAASYLAIIAALLLWRPAFPPRTLPPESLGQAMGAGLRYVAMSPHIGVVLLRGFLFGLTSVAVLALLPIVARHLVAGGALTYGLLLGAFGVGAIGGAFLATRLRGRLSAEWIVRIAFAAFAVAAATTALSPFAWATGLGLMLGGAAWVLALSLFNVTVQLSTPRWVVGRALALYQTAVFGGMALGAWTWGLLAEARGVEFALLVAAGGLLAGGLAGLAAPLPDRRELDLAPLDRFREPALGVDLQPRSGPVAITVEYRIRTKDLPEFLEAMAERQRMRQRDGARHWTLMRDLADPEIWVEFYQTATWIDYLRHHQRATKADGEVVDRLRALHAGPDLPIVRRRLVRQTRWLPSANLHHHDRGAHPLDPH